MSVTLLETAVQVSRDLLLVMEEARENRLEWAEPLRACARNCYPVMSASSSRPKHVKWPNPKSGSGEGAAAGERGASESPGNARGQNEGRGPSCDPQPCG